MIGEIEIAGCIGCYLSRETQNIGKQDALSVRSARVRLLEHAIVSIVRDIDVPVVIQGDPKRPVHAATDDTLRIAATGERLLQQLTMKCVGDIEVAAPIDGDSQGTSVPLRAVLCV